VIPPKKIEKKGRKVEEKGPYRGGISLLTTAAFWDAFTFIKRELSNHLFEEGDGRREALKAKGKGGSWG